MKNNNKDFSFNNNAVVTNNYMPLKREDYLESSNINMEIRKTDIMLVLTINGTVSKEGIKNTIIGEALFLDDIKDINLSTLFKNLNAININKINIYSISKLEVQEGFNFSNDHKEYLYLELGIENFLQILQVQNFLEFNKYSLYIFRDMNYFEIKNLITKIDDCSVIIGRGSSQKSHILSPLELRLSTYLLAMFNFDYHQIFKLNRFNSLSKNQYLPTKNKEYKLIDQ